MSLKRQKDQVVARVAQRMAQVEQTPYTDHDVGEQAWLAKWDAELKKLIRYDDAIGHGRLRAAIEGADWESAERLAQDYSANRIYQWMQMGRQAQLAGPGQFAYNWQVEASGTCEISAESPAEAALFARDRFNQNLGAVIQDSYNMQWTGQIASHDGGVVESIPWRREGQSADPGRQAQILWKICNVLRSSPIWDRVEPAAQLLDQTAQELAAQAGSEFSQLVDQSTIDAEPTAEDLMWFGSR